MAREKPHMNLIFIGHVDQGKSTTVGRMLYDTGNIPEQDMRKLQEKAKELGKSGFEFAFVMDNLKEEQARGVTIDLSHKRFVTDKYDVTIIDAPGHRDFIKNMITGASQADAAILVISGNKGEAEAGLDSKGQTSEHIFLSKTLGVNQIVVSINKMDMVDFDEARFNEVKEKVSERLKAVGFNPDEIQFIPTAAFTGDNLAKKSEKTPWYSGPHAS